MEKEIREKKVISYNISWDCAKDGCKGEMVWTCVEKTCYPPLYEHRCTECERTELANKIYPYRKFK